MPRKKQLHKEQAIKHFNFSKIFFAAITLWLLQPNSLFAQRPVMLTVSPATTGEHNVDVYLGGQYFQKHLAPEPGLAESITRVGIFGWHLGVSDNVNIDLDWRGYLFATLRNGAKVNDWGDLTVSTRVQIVPERGNTPGIGFLNSVKLPNTKHTPYGLGSDETDVYTYVLLGKHWGEVEARLNIGFGILGDPKKLNSQDDVYLMSMALIIPVSETVVLFGETFGLVGYFNDDDKLIARFGGMLKFDDFELDVFGSAGIAGSKVDIGGAFEASESWSLGVALKKSFELGFLKTEEE